MQKLSVIPSFEINSDIKLEMWQEYYYIDLTGEARAKIYKDDMSDRSIMDTSRVFVNKLEMEDYVKFWNLTEKCSVPFKTSGGGLFTIIVDPSSFQISIARTNEYIPNFIYFKDEEKAKNYINEAGANRILKYLYNIAL